ncbi:hypothetical protein E3T54_15980 [Cryobacterium sp. Sr8]|uniref:hypothetical protein n=1 Tax=Cryobacterium sp. Sr8 TaxID=1259203 RepID=UPI00106A2934|nr:hypothetical protein [Cryobacterium sp. Sr8]TFD74265.1 hypothetical protein E3T54_15980 [Cryobacterium sp. Sr8]
MTELRPQTAARPNRVTGVGRLLIAVYGVLALAATGRSFVQIVGKYDQAPLAYSLSALAAVVYIVATVALVNRGRGWYRTAWITITFELLGVLVIGTLSLVDPALFPHDTVWSVFGRGYLFIPLALPVLGMWWLARHPVAGVEPVTSDS